MSGTKIVSEYDQEMAQSQTAYNPMAQRGGATQPSRDTRKTNKAKCVFTDIQFNSHSIWSTEMNPIA